MSGASFERKIDEFFGKGERPQKGSDSPADLTSEDIRKVDTVANNIKNICLANGVYTLDNFFDPQALARLLTINKIDLETFKQALM